MIEQGRVSVDGKTITSPALNVTEANVIMVDGQRLPAAEHTRAEKPQLAEAGRQRRRRIVLVEDDRDELESLRMLLVEKGHVVFTAEDGDSGLERIRKEHPEVVIMDIALPRLNGYEIAETVRAQQSTVFLIAMTGYGRPEDKRRAHDAGFNAHLTKPADLQKLDELLDSVP